MFRWLVLYPEKQTPNRLRIIGDVLVASPSNPLCFRLWGADSPLFYLNHKVISLSVYVRGRAANNGGSGICSLYASFDVLHDPLHFEETMYTTTVKYCTALFHLSCIISGNPTTASLPTRVRAHQRKYLDGNSFPPDEDRCSCIDGEQTSQDACSSR